MSPFNTGPRAVLSTDLYVWPRFVACLAAFTSILEYGTTCCKTCRVVPPWASSVLQPWLGRNATTQQQQYYNGKKSVFALHSTKCILLLFCLLYSTYHTFTIYKDTISSPIVQVLFTLCRRVQCHFVTTEVKYLYTKSQWCYRLAAPLAVLTKR